jgi:hypothetical protein
LKLINRVGEKPEPTFGDIKSALVDCLAIAQSLEDGAAIRDAEAKAAILEEENSNLKLELQALKTEVDGFRAERKKQEEKKREIDPTQFKILQLLRSESESKRLRIDEIARAVKIPVDEAEVYINGLEKRGLAIFHHHEPGGGGWHRTTEGNTLVVAKRWAGEGDQDTRKYPNLPTTQHEILLLIAAGQDDGANENYIAAKLGKTLGLVRYNLKALREADMASDIEWDADYGTGCVFYLCDTGAEYLEERDLL